MPRPRILLTMLSLVLVLGACGGSQDRETSGGGPPQHSEVTAAEHASPGAAALAGTNWRAGGMTIAFREDGNALIDGGEQARWSYNAGAVMLEAGADSYAFVFEDGELRYGGMAAERIP